jgi:hypothetical protein
VPPFEKQDSVPTETLAAGERHVARFRNPPIYHSILCRRLASHSLPSPFGVKPAELSL